MVRVKRMLLKNGKIFKFGKRLCRFAVTFKYISGASCSDLNFAYISRRLKNVISDVWIYQSMLLHEQERIYTLNL